MSKKYKCDICGIEMDEDKLTTLREELRPDQYTNDLCDECHKQVQVVWFRISAVVIGIKENWMRRFVRRLKEKCNSKNS